ncbi:MAG: hypothetical protein M1482_00215 [Chloroflexi bacterium]|nr:hypothetical protein [Chloroflexota bacterium]
MQNRIIRSIATLTFGITVIALAGCSPAFAGSPTGTPTVSAVPTLAAQTAPTGTDTPAATATAAGTATPTLGPTTAPTKRAATPRPRPTATATVTPGIYVTGIQIRPNPGVSEQPPQFLVTFLNTTGQTQPFRWFVKIYQPDEPQSFGETPKVDSDIAPNSSALAVSDWKTTTVLQCMPFIARVFWVDQNNQVNEFFKPDGTNPATGFDVCP